MKGEKIEILRDTSGANEGDVIIRLVGLFELPGSPVFRIEPLDEDASEGGTPDWPQGELTARHMRVGDTGVELIVGADVVDAPALLPGTPVAISVPSASLRQELRWPTLIPVKSSKRSVVVVSAEKRRAEIAARAKARRAELENMAAVRLAAEAAASAARGKSQTETTATPVAAEESLSRLDSKRKGAVKLVSSRDTNEARASLRMPSPSAGVEPVVSSAAAPILPPLPKTASTIPMARAAAQALPDRMNASSPLSAPRREMAGPIPAPGTPAEFSLPGFPPDPTDMAAAKPLNALEPKRAPPPKPPQIDPPPVPARQAPSASHLAVHANNSGPPMPPDTPRFLTRPGNDSANPPNVMRAFTLGFLVAGVLALVSTFAMKSDMLHGDAGSAALTSQVVAQKPEDTLKTLSAVLAVPDVSNNGADASNVDLAGALNRADELLSAGPDADKEEAKYWLRRALAQGLSEKRMVWALTQLGTLYAAPASGAPDYAAARTVWELAAAQGDPVALCFLAAIHEHGLGVPADEVHALVLYRNAKAEGGCKDVDSSIKRLSKGTP